MYVREGFSGQATVKGGVPQGSELEPSIFVYDLTGEEQSYLDMFADDAVFMNEMRRNEECEM